MAAPEAGHVQDDLPTASLQERQANLREESWAGNVRSKDVQERLGVYSESGIFGALRNEIGSKVDDE